MGLKETTRGVPQGGVLVIFGVKRRIGIQPLLSHDVPHGSRSIYPVSSTTGDEGGAARLGRTAAAHRVRAVQAHARSCAATANAADPLEVIAAHRPARQSRLYVRLTPGDRQLLQARCAARGLAPATYASVLLRAHLRAVTPLPEAELRAIRQSTRELAAIGRNLNQIAHATHQGGLGGGVNREPAEVHQGL